MGEGQAGTACVVTGFDGGEPGGFDREAGGCMEVMGEGADAVEVMGIECRGGCAPLGGNSCVVSGAKRETPESGSAIFTPTGEEDGVVFGKDGYTIFLKEDFATVIVELADSDEIVLEGVHDFGVADSYVRKWQVAGGRRLVGLAGCVADVGGGSSGVDVNDRGLWHQVDVAGTAVDDGSVGETDGFGGWGGTKTRSRRQQN